MMNQLMLKQLYEQFLLLPFPHLNGQEEALTNWTADLNETDSYYAGLAATLIKGRSVQVKRFSLDPLFESLSTLRSQSSISENQYRECKQYLLALDKLVKGIEDYLHSQTLS